MSSENIKFLVNHPDPKTELSEVSKKFISGEISFEEFEAEYDSPYIDMPANVLSDYEDEFYSEVKFKLANENPSKFRSWLTHNLNLFESGIWVPEV
jgi:hypothetical protein